jgi:hypothetical protein
MNQKRILIPIFITLLTSCQHKIKLNDLYEFVITKAIEHSSYGTQPQPKIDRVVVGEIGPGDEDFHKDLLRNSKYKRCKLSYEDIERLRIRDKYQYTSKSNTLISVSDELFYTNSDEYLIYYRLNQPGGGIFYRLHFKKDNNIFEVIDLVEEAIYKE